MWLVSTGAVSGNLPFRLDPGEYIVGRSKKAHILIKDLTVSNRHAKLVCTRKSLIVEDLRSRNGTFVNEQPADIAPIQLGNQVRFGSVSCMICPAALIPAGSQESGSTFAVGGPSSPTLDTKGLTPAQQQVLGLMLQGHGEEEIAHQLGRSWHTVHTHLKAIFKHFGVHSRTELIARLLAGKKSRRLP